MHDPLDSLVLTICTSPTIQRTLVVDEFAKDDLVRARETWVEAGGKGVFVSRVLRQLGIPTKHLSHGGQNQSELSSLLDHEGFPYQLVHAGSRIRHCSTIVELDPEKSVHDHPVVRTVTEIIEPCGNADSKIQNQLFETIVGTLDDISVLVISGSMAPGYQPEFYSEVLKEALSRNIFTILDIRGQELLLAYEHQPHVVKINMAEFAKTFLPEKAGFIEHCEDAHNESHLELLTETLEDLTEDTRSSIILTRGPRSVWYGVDGKFGEFVLPAIPKSKILNPVGSGDAFAAGIAAFVHSHGQKDMLRDGFNDSTIREAIIVGSRCAQENARLLRPGRIR